MKSYLNFESLYSNISNEQIRNTQIISYALGSGMTLFFGVTLFYYYLEYIPDPNILEETHNLFYLKYLSILAFISLLVMSYIQPLKVLSNELDAVKNDNITEKDYDKFVGIHRSYLIVRLALLEGAGLFGLVIFFMSILNYTIYSFPIYWICTIPAIVMILYVIILFPTKTKVSNFILENMI